MTFTITYRDPRFAGFAGASIVTSAPQARETLERLRREGYEVTSTVPRLPATQRRVSLI
jgi:hypothetical protein